MIVKDVKLVQSIDVWNDTCFVNLLVNFNYTRKLSGAVQEGYNSVFASELTAQRLVHACSVDLTGMLNAGRIASSHMYHMRLSCFVKCLLLLT